jgi:hypothetical protein
MKGSWKRKGEFVLTFDVNVDYNMMPTVGLRLFVYPSIERGKMWPSDDDDLLGFFVTGTEAP